MLPRRLLLTHARHIGRALIDDAMACAMIEMIATAYQARVRPPPAIFPPFRAFKRREVAEMPERLSLSLRHTASSAIACCFSIDGAREMPSTLRRLAADDSYRRILMMPRRAAPASSAHGDCQARDVDDAARRCHAPHAIAIRRPELSIQADAAGLCRKMMLRVGALRCTAKRAYAGRPATPSAAYAFMRATRHLPSPALIDAAFYYLRARSILFLLL